MKPTAWVLNINTSRILNQVFLLGCSLTVYGGKFTKLGDNNNVTATTSLLGYKVIT